MFLLLSGLGIGRFFLLLPAGLADCSLCVCGPFLVVDGLLLWGREVVSGRGREWKVRLCPSHWERRFFVVVVEECG
jgi:hypothetical protein